MNFVVYIVFFLAFFVEYVIERLGLPGILKYSPDALSAALLVFLLLRAAVTKQFAVPPKYLLLFAFFLLHAIFGVILNDVDGNAVIAGMRYHLRFFPIFILPAIYPFTERQIKAHVFLLLGFGLTQVPITLFQRFIQFTSRSGDSITGSLGSSSILTIYVVCTLLVLLAFYMRNRISGRRSLMIASLLFLPCILNETKITVVLMVVGVFSILLLATGSKLGFKRIVSVLSAFSVFLVLFVVGYNQLYAKDKPGGLLSYFFNDRAAVYLYKESEIDSEILDKHIQSNVIPDRPYQENMEFRRVDSMIAPFKILINKPMKMYFGLGIGNVSAFNYSDFEGEYAHLSEALRVEHQTLLLIIWELGIGGALLYLLLFWLVLMDARSLSQQESFAGSLALGWIGVSAVLVLSLVYTNILQFSSIGFPYFYFSGILVTALFTHKHSEPESAVLMPGTKPIAVGSQIAIER